MQKHIKQKSNTSKVLKYAFRLRKRPPQPVYNMKKDVHGTKNKNCNPMGIGLGIDYVTWWEILKWIPPASKLHVGTRFNKSWARVVKTSLLLCCGVLRFVRARCFRQRARANRTGKSASRRIMSKGMNRTRKAASNAVFYSQIRDRRIFVSLHAPQSSSFNARIRRARNKMRKLGDDFKVTRTCKLGIDGKNLQRIRENIAAHGIGIEE